MYILKNNTHTQRKNNLLCTLLLFISTYFGLAQQQNISLHLEKQSIKKALELIKRQSDFTFLYQPNQVEVTSKVSITIEKGTIHQVLKELFKNQNIQYSFNNKHIILQPILERNIKVQGCILDTNNTPIPDVHIYTKDLLIGTKTDEKGIFTLEKKHCKDTIYLSHVGFKRKKLLLKKQKNIYITLEHEHAKLQDVIVLGNRSKPRTILSSAAAIQSIDKKELEYTAQQSIAQMLMYSLGSFNTSCIPVSDATAHFNPADLRGLGSGRTLVLINGKRKNLSAQVHLNNTPGKGEVGVDLTSIPSASIKRIDVLHNAGSAQYGSDAIAGVINITLKEKTKYTDINHTSGITSKKDGAYLKSSIHHGFGIGKKGFFNATLEYHRQQKTNRAGSPGQDVELFNVDANDAVYGDWIKKNPKLGMIIGQPEFKKISSFYNTKIPVGSSGFSIYSFGGFTYRTGKSFAFYRTPYWKTTDYGVLDPKENYDGYHPTFETNINDHTNTIGASYTTKSFQTDISATLGGNTVYYYIDQSINSSLQEKSPSFFKAGGYSFHTLIGNIDFRKNIKHTDISFGLELRVEDFRNHLGDPASYIGYGADSFSGISPSTYIKVNRTNKALYFGIDQDISDKLLLSSAFRHENTADFSSYNSWKLSARYFIGNKKGALRMFYHTGYRVASLHQTYLKNIQYSTNEDIPKRQATFRANSPVLQELGIAKLRPEIANNTGIGISYPITSFIDASVDMYCIHLKDRIVFSSNIASIDGALDGSDPVEKILLENNVSGMKFFVNAIDTKTFGIDLQLKQHPIYFKKFSLYNSIMLNWNTTTLKKHFLNTTAPIYKKYDIFNRTEAGRITNATPELKILLHHNLQYKKLNLIINNSYFGKVSYFGKTKKEDQVFSPKIITDLMLQYKIQKHIKLSAFVNNIGNIYPEKSNKKGNTIGGRFMYARDVNQFGIRGTVLNIGFSLKF